MVTSFTDIELTGRRNTTFDNAEGSRSTARGWEIDMRLPIFDWGGMQRDAMNAANADGRQSTRSHGALCGIEPARKLFGLPNRLRRGAALPRRSGAGCAR